MRRAEKRAVFYAVDGAFMVRTPPWAGVLLRWSCLYAGAARALHCCCALW